jgi:osmoprotectant transport system substrate-binding protein
MKPRYAWRIAVLLIALLFPAVAACNLLPGSNPGGDTIRIGSKNFTEQLILGNMYAQLLESRGMKVERVLNLGGTAEAHEALTGGTIDLYPEYTGTALVAILKERPRSDSQAVYSVVSKQYRERFKLVWLDQAPMNNSQALAVKRQFSEERSLTTISQMAAMASQLTLAAVPDFPERDDGLVGLKRVYGNFNFKEIHIFDPPAKYSAFLMGQANVVLAFGTDGEIKGHDLVVLADDKGLWPPYHVAPVVRQSVLEKHPNLTRILNELAPLLTDDVMRTLNWRVDGPEKASPAKVAEDFLRGRGLID